MTAVLVVSDVAAAGENDTVSTVRLVMLVTAALVRDVTAAVKH